MEQKNGKQRKIHPYPYGSLRCRPVRRCVHWILVARQIQQPNEQSAFPHVGWLESRPKLSGTLRILRQVHIVNTGIRFEIIRKNRGKKAVSHQPQNQLTTSEPPPNHFRTSTAPRMHSLAHMHPLNKKSSKIGGWYLFKEFSGVRRIVTLQNLVYTIHTTRKDTFNNACIWRYQMEDSLRK